MTSPALPMHDKSTLTIERKPTFSATLAQNYRRLVARLAVIDLSYQDPWERRRR